MTAKLINITSKDIHDRAIKDKCSFSYAHSIILKEKLFEALEEAKNIDEVKEVIYWLITHM